MLKHRLITGPVLILALLGVLWFDAWLDGVALSGFWSDLFRGKSHLPRGLALFGLALCVVPFAAFELANIFSADGIATRRWLVIASAWFGLVLSYSIPLDLEAARAIAIVSTGLFIMFIASLLTYSRNRNVQGIVASAGAVMFAMVYLGLMMGFFLAIRRSHSAWWIVGIILVTKACDTGAYFTGRAIGRHKLIPWLSPGKTWEGLMGGIALATLAGMGLAAASAWLTMPQDHVPIWLGACCGVVFALVGQLGDLAVSLLKRGAGLKDSSSILPGLGGVLDVLDSPLMVAPVAYWMLKLALGD